MSIFRQVLLNIELYLPLWKWSIPIFGILFISYTTMEQLNTSVNMYGLNANIWDAIFAVLGNIYFDLLFVLLPFIFIVGDLATTSQFNTHVVFKLQTRRCWWLGKIATIAVSAILYVGLVVIGITLTMLPVTPWQEGWSDLAVSTPVGHAVTATMLSNIPFFYVAIIMIMLTLGLFAIGLLTIIGTLLSNSSGKGFLLGVAVIIGGGFAQGAQLRPPLRDLFISVHLLPFYHYEDVYRGIALAVIYWTVCIAVLLILGFICVRELDFW